VATLVERLHKLLVESWRLTCDVVFGGSGYLQLRLVDVAVFVSDSGQVPPIFLLQPSAFQDRDEVGSELKHEIIHAIVHQLDASFTKISSLI